MVSPKHPNAIIDHVVDAILNITKLSIVVAYHLVVSEPLNPLGFGQEGSGLISFSKLGDLIFNPKRKEVLHMRKAQ